MTCGTRRSPRRSLPLHSNSDSPVDILIGCRSNTAFGLPQSSAGRHAPITIKSRADTVTYTVNAADGIKRCVGAHSPRIPLMCGFRAFRRCKRTSGKPLFFNNLLTRDDKFRMGRAQLMRHHKPLIQKGISGTPTPTRSSTDRPNPHG